MTYYEIIKEATPEELAQTLHLVQLSTLRTVLKHYGVPFDEEKLKASSDEVWLKWLNTEVEQWE